MTQKSFEIISHQSVRAVFDSYPNEIRAQMERLRQLIIETAEEIDGIGKLEETLKWGGPSYLCKQGSTIRIAWKESAPDTIGVYFNCRTKLIDTFRALFKEQLHFEGNREIVIDLNKKLPEEILRTCISLALTYHNRKHLQLLGA
jgi:hypothetical protein